MVLLIDNSGCEGRVDPKPRARGSTATVVPRIQLLTAAVAIRSFGWGFGRVDDVKVEECMGL